jgi:hypothetical protein
MLSVSLRGCTPGTPAARGTRGVSFKSQCDPYDMRLLANIDRGTRTVEICPVKTQPRFDGSNQQIETVRVDSIRKSEYFLDIFGKALRMHHSELSGQLRRK